ncbi:MAG: PEP-utilizing enzyme [Patescibacteria group bacterium]
MNNALPQIFSKKWFLGIRREESLFFYSSKFIDREKFTLKKYENNFVESILIPHEDNELIRAFNSDQAKLFHQESKEKVLKDFSIIEKFISHDDTLWVEIQKLSEKLAKSVEKLDFKKAKGIFQRILEKYGEHGAYFFFIFSVGMMLEGNKEEVANSKPALAAHDKWRNEVAFKEEKMGENLFGFFKLLKSQSVLNTAEKEMMEFLTAGEVLALASCQITKEEIENKIARRKQNGYVYLYLRDLQYQDVVIDDLSTVEAVKKYFESMEAPAGKVIEGQVAFPAKEKIIGEAVVLKDKSELGKADLAGKILVTIQTTPHFIPYLKNVKAIITDEGGITCHAAIVARELKIPCVIGTKIATKILKDGDKVEVDAEKGVVKIIKNV